MKPSDWKTYRTRFLVKAKQLSAALTFTDPLGRQHCGRKGDYLVESFDGVISIAPRQIFEDIYVPISLTEDAIAVEARPGQMPGNLNRTAATIQEKVASAMRTGDRRMRQRRIADRAINHTRLNRQDFEALEIEHVKLGKPPLGQQSLNRQETVRGKRKLPQPVRERRASLSALRLM